MGRADSALRDRMLFVVGARRSGTTWLQMTLDAHPDIVAIPSETFLFSHGLAPLARLFQHGSPRSIAVGHTYIDRESMLDGFRDFCDLVYGELARLLDPQARIVMDRTTLHATVLDLIGEVYPDAHVLHLIRDGRDAARSLVHRSWGPQTMAEAAAEWRDTVEAARRAAPSLSRYREVRYEHLVTHPREGLAEIAQWLGVAADEASLAPMWREAEVVVNANPAENLGLAKWRTRMSPSALAEFDAVAGDLLAELGYPPSFDGTTATKPQTSGTGPVPSGTPPRRPRTGQPMITRWRGRLRRRLHGPVLSQIPVETAQRLLDRLLNVVADPARYDLAELVRPDAEVTIITDGQRSVDRGPQALQRLTAQLAADAVGVGRLVASESWPSVAAATAYLEHETTAGSRLCRTVVAEVDADRIVAVRYVVLGGPRS